MGHIHGAHLCIHVLQVCACGVHNAAFRVPILVALASFLAHTCSCVLSYLYLHRFLSLSLKAACCNLALLLAVFSKLSYFFFSFFSVFVSFQLCLNLALQTAIEHDCRVVFVDSGGSFSARRLFQMAAARGLKVFISPCCVVFYGLLKN